ncbi:hypothetical protein MTR_2g437420 [Medicago truncatula]|uniref:Uncharacterized protein n=1 Tax=Medicago truncatula TaxID=3880 RepID=A0A072V669_MEDTR|nr:hypothetical protein MTR_2g437420 [Medicago truncatula]
MSLAVASESLAIVSYPKFGCRFWCLNLKFIDECVQKYRHISSIGFYAQGNNEVEKYSKSLT